MIYIAEAIYALYPEVVRTAGGIAYDIEGNQVAYDDAAVALKAQEIQAKLQRSAAYTAEADPLFFKAQRGEATTDEWTAKVAEIKARFPYPAEGGAA